MATTTKWEEVIFNRDPSNLKKVKYENRVSFYHRQGDWKVENSNKKILCKGHTKDMGMIISHLVHSYASNSTYTPIDRSKKIRIYFKETVTIDKADLK